MLTTPGRAGAAVIGDCPGGAAARRAPPGAFVAEVAPLAITDMRPVGQYAYANGFSAGHSSGIYTLEYLRELA